MWKWSRSETSLVKVFPFLFFRAPPRLSMQLWHFLHRYLSLSTGDRRRLLCSLTGIIRSRSHWLTQKQRQKWKKGGKNGWWWELGRLKCDSIRWGECASEREQIKYMDVLRVSVRLNARWWSCDCLLLATTLSVCGLWQRITQQLFADHFMVFVHDTES